MTKKRSAIEFVPLSAFSPHIRKVLKTCWYEVCLLMGKDVIGLLNVVIVSTQHMRALNRKHRGIDKATDVLSLDFGQDKIGHKLGFVFLCQSIAKKQAQKLGHDIDQEIVFLVTHGMLHVWGFDHEKMGDEKKMLTMHKRLLEAFPKYSPLFSTYRSRELIDY